MYGTFDIGRDNLKPDRVIGMKETDIIAEKWKELHAGNAYLCDDIHDTKSSKNKDLKW